MRSWAQDGAGVVQHFPRRADGLGDCALDVGQVGEVLSQAHEQGKVFAADQLAVVVAGGGEGALDGVKFLAPQDAVEDGPLNQVAQVHGGAKFQGAPLVEEGPGLGGFLLAEGDFGPGRGKGRRAWARSRPMTVRVSDANCSRIWSNSSNSRERPNPPNSWGWF